MDLNKSAIESTGVCTSKGGGVQYPQRRPHRRPSTGNLLSEDRTTSEEDFYGSDNDEVRREAHLDQVIIYIYIYMCVCVCVRVVGS